MRKLITAIALCVACNQSLADASGSFSFMTAGQLLTACNSTEPFHYGSCLNYIAGTIDTMNMLMDLGAVTKEAYCIPGDVSQTRTRFVTVAHITNNPEFHNYVAADQIIQALGTAFPCNSATK